MKEALLVNSQRDVGAYGSQSVGNQSTLEAMGVRVDDLTLILTSYKF
jgi:hypothetical protein